MVGRLPEERRNESQFPPLLVEDVAVVFGGRTVDLGVVVRVEEQTEFHERAPEGMGRAAGSAGARPRAASKRGITSRAKSSREWR